MKKFKISFKNIPSYNYLLEDEFVQVESIIISAESENDAWNKFFEKVLNKNYIQQESIEEIK